MYIRICHSKSSGGQKGSFSLKCLTHISCSDETWYSYTLPKKDPKNILIT